MSLPPRWITLTIILGAALLLYFAGMMRESVALLGIGAVLETMFWISLLRPDRHRSNTRPQSPGRADRQ